MVCKACFIGLFIIIIEYMQYYSKMVNKTAQSTVLYTKCTQLLLQTI